MDKLPVSILIPNFNAHEAIELCVESILARTRCIRDRIIAYDNLGNGQDRQYLRRMRDAGHLTLLENDGPPKRPGESMVELINACDTRFACFVESDCEILRSDWLELMWGLRNRCDNTVAVARWFRPRTCGPWYVAPAWGPECMLLDLELYRPIAEPNDWQQRSVPVNGYKYMDLFAGHEPDEPSNGYVNLDTCWRFTEKVEYEKDRYGLRVEPLPADFFSQYVWHYGGISTRPTRPEIQPRWQEIRDNLRALRQGMA